MGTNFPTATIKSYFETGDKPTQAQFATFIDGVGAIDDNSPLNNLAAIVAPTVNDDSNDGYSVGSVWVNTATGEIYTCVSPSVSAAIWQLAASSASLPFGAEVAVASAATVNIGAVQTHLAAIGGTTTTSSFGSSASLGAPIYMLRCVSAGWSITLGPNILCDFASGSLVSAAGVYYVLQYLGVGVWKIISSSAGQFNDDGFRVVDGTIKTKKVAFEVSGVSASTTRTVAVQDADGTMLITGGLDVPIADGGTGTSDGTSMISPNKGYSTGAYYCSPTSNAIGGSLVLTPDTLYFAPFIIGSAVTMTRISIIVSSGVAGNVRLGIYNSDNANLPGTLLVDGGTISVATTGVKEVTISQALSPGIYWTALVGNVAATIKGNITNPFCSAYVGMTNINTGGGLPQGFEVSFPYAVLPANSGVTILNTVFEGPYMLLGRI